MSIRRHLRRIPGYSRVTGKIKAVLIGGGKRQHILVRAQGDQVWSQPDHYLCIATLFRNEAPYLAEWLEFHRMLGVEHFYLYDNNSTDGSAAVLAPYVADGVVTLTPWGFPWRIGPTTSQVMAFAHAIATFGSRCRWMAFINVDEFLFPTEGDSLAEFLREYEDLPALVTFWTMFGTSGHPCPPPGLVIENFTMRAPFPTHAKTKTIANPAAVVAVPTAHLFDLVDGPYRGYTETREVYRLDEDQRGERKIVGTPVSRRLQLNHYYTRSQQELDRKIAMWVERDKATPGDRPGIAAAVERTPVRDTAILRFVPALRERLHAARMHEGRAPVSPV